MRHFLFLICITTFSCTNRNPSTDTKLSRYDTILLSENFDTTAVYAEKSCLHYKGKPLLTLGQTIKLFDATFSFRPDPNGKYEKYFNDGITDYLSLDDFYSSKFSTGTIDGALYFSEDKQKRVFRLEASFSIYAELVDTSGMEIINCLHDKYFPCLPTDFKGKQSFELTHKNFKEQFRLFPSPDSGDVEHGFKPHWSLDYSIAPTKKNGM